MRFLKASAVVASAAAGLIFAGTSAIAAPAESAPSAEPAAMEVCGFYENHVTAFYAHCADSCIWIVVDYESGPNQYKQILQRGTVDIGGARDVNNAWYSHVC
ncbi:DUF6355 family natural product biosynthesis protein [Amycolatopsis roodepoortensis]|uniref:Secreted protein n=1 Tax=Amycolatopsis roodepoortensis TaxID=700274 RepID=A0ABR9KY82_9PSEU|nr:DUF6355 family natural product biosynthesis protein [Amycolatopsis roodepoortensis]MBE1573071.1 hypothetical protein [Amycolatopsis roodepoortensis]